MSELDELIDRFAERAETLKDLTAIEESALWAAAIRECDDLGDALWPVSVDEMGGLERIYLTAIANAAEAIHLSEHAPTSSVYLKRSVEAQMKLAVTIIESIKASLAPELNMRLASRYWAKREELEEMA